MDTVSIVLFLLLAVVISGAISRMLPISLPTPLVQILLGAGIGLAERLTQALLELAQPRVQRSGDADQRQKAFGKRHEYVLKR